MTKLHLPLAAAYAFIYFICLWYEDELLGKLWIMAGLVWLCLWGAGGILLIASIVPDIFHSRRQISSATQRHSIAALLMVLLPCWIHFHFGSVWTSDLRFALDRPHYEAQVRQILSLPQSMSKEDQVGDARIDRKGGIVRIAFVQPGGILDNYTAIVYDPSGAVEKINAAKNWKDWGSPRFNAVRELFGGDLTSAHPLGGGWYRCTFT